MINLLNNYTFQIVAVGSTLLGIICGIIGTFSVLKKESLIGDTVSHSALPGICLAYILTGEKNLVILLIGAFFSSILGILLIRYFEKKRKNKFDNLLALILSSFFGLGIVLLTYIQKMPGSNKAGLNKFIFGQAAAILKEDIYVILITSLILIFILIIFWKNFKVLVFDYTYSISIYGRKKTLFYNLLLSLITIISIIIGLEIVGAILISALVIIPAVTARQWTNNFNFMIILSGFFGGISGFIGTLLSSSKLNMPTGAIIIIILGIIFIFSIFFSNRRGLFKKYLYKRNIQKLVINELNSKKVGDNIVE